MQMHFRKNRSNKISRMKTRTFTLIKLLMRKSYESGISFCRQQDRAGCCQSPDLLSSFFIPLLNCSNARLFQCFSVPSSFHVPCSSVLTSRGKIKFLLQSKLSARQATRYYARSYTARKRAGRKNGKSKEQKVAPRGEVLNPME